MATLAEQAHGAAADATAIATQFKKTRTERMDEPLATLSFLGQARPIQNDRYIAA